MIRILALSTALMLTLFVSVPGDFNPRTDKGVSYTALIDEDSYTNHNKQDEKKFLPRQDFTVTAIRAVYFSFIQQVSIVVHEPEALNIRGPPSSSALA